MADLLVTPAELASFLQVDSVDTATAVLVIGLATGKVQAACGQRLVDTTWTGVQIDVAWGDCGPWLPLPQLPVRSVASVLIDGVADTTWRLRRQQLWRIGGWSLSSSAPSQVTVAFTSGYPAGAQALEPARNDVLVLCAMAYSNATGATSEAIDDYKVTYAEADARMQVTPGMRDQLRATYGAGAYVSSSQA